MTAFVEVGGAAGNASANDPLDAPEMKLHADDPTDMAEVERLLASRTRDIRLKGEIHRLFRERT